MTGATVRMQGLTRGRFPARRLLAAVLTLAGFAFADEPPEIFAQLGHSGRVHALAISPDGRFIASMGLDRAVRVWETATGREWHAFPCDVLGNSYGALAFSPDNRQLLAGNRSSTIQSWSLVGPRQMRRFPVAKEEPILVRRLRFSPDGRAFAVLSTSTLQLHDAASGKMLRLFKAKTKVLQDLRAEVEPYLRDFAFSPDGKRIVSAGDSLLVLWDVGKGAEEACMPIPWDEGTAAGEEAEKPYLAELAISPRGRFVALARCDGALRLWDAGSRQWGKPLQTHTGERRDVSVTFTGDDEHLMAATDAGDVRQWRVTDGAPIADERVELPAPRAVTVRCADGGRYVAFGSGPTILLRDLAGGRTLELGGNVSEPVRVFFSVGGDLIHVLYGDPRSMSVFALGGSLEVTRYVEEDLARCGADAVAFQREGTGIVLDTATGREIVRFSADGDFHSRLEDIEAFFPDGRRAVTLQTDHDKQQSQATVIQFPSRIPERSFVVSPAIFGMRFSPDQRYFVDWGFIADHLSVYDGRTGSVLKALPEPSGNLSDALFMPDRPHLLATSYTEIKIWDIDSGKVVKTLVGHTAPVQSLALSRDGSRVLSGSWDRTLRLWDVDTGKSLKTFSGHADDVRRVSFSPHGDRVLSGSDDGTVRLWDVATGVEIARFVSFTDGEWIVMTPDGHFNASPNGAKYLNVRVGSQVYSVDRFHEMFFDPVRVASVLQGRPVGTAADIRRGIQTPPEVSIDSPAPNASFTTDTLAVTVSARDTGGGIEDIRLYHNGKAVGEASRGVKVAAVAGAVTKVYTVTLVDGLNTFRATAFSRDRTEANPREIAVHLKAPAKEVDLHVLAVGVNSYRNPALNLNYANPDARGIAAFFRDTGGGLFRKVSVMELYDEQATKQQITDRLRMLSGTQPQDAVLIFLAGHGETLGDRWHFIPHELIYPEREEDVRAGGISSAELATLIRNIPAQKVLVLIDACKSGAMLVAFRGFEDRKALAQLSRSTGVHVMAASGKDQVAAELKELGHGVFTHTLLAGLKGGAAGDGEPITVRKLMGYVIGQLPDITKKYRQEAQFPVIDSRGQDFPLALGGDPQERTQDPGR